MEGFVFVPREQPSPNPPSEWVMVEEPTAEHQDDGSKTEDDDDAHHTQAEPIACGAGSTALLGLESDAQTARRVADLCDVRTEEETDGAPCGHEPTCELQQETLSSVRVDAHADEVNCTADEEAEQEEELRRLQEALHEASQKAFLKQREEEEQRSAAEAQRLAAADAAESEMRRRLLLERQRADEEAAKVIAEMEAAEVQQAEERDALERQAAAARQAEQAAESHAELVAAQMAADLEAEAQEAEAARLLALSLDEVSNMRLAARRDEDAELARHMAEAEQQSVQGRSPEAPCSCFGASAGFHRPECPFFAP